MELASIEKAICSKCGYTPFCNSKMGIEEI